MNPVTMETLWDPNAEGDESDEFVRALEARLRPLRSPEQVPELDLPDLDVPERGERAAGLASEGSARGWTVAMLIAAVLALAWFAWPLRAPTDAVERPRIADVELPPTPVPSPEPVVGADEVWRVESFEGEPNCNDPRASEDAGLQTGVVIHTGEATAHLVRGPAQVDVHPESEIIRGPRGLELVRGRLWAELPRIAGGAAWVVELGPVEVSADAARFVGWATDEEVGVDVVSGALRLPDGQRVAAGQRCVASRGAGPLVSVEAFRCASSG